MTARNRAGAAGLTATIFNIMRFSTQDGPGIRTTVFFKGCPLSCWWCHNPESQSFLPEVLYLDEHCRHCGDCSAACPAHRIAADGAVLAGGGCRRCGQCAGACQAEARRLVGRKVTVGELLREVERDLVFFEESGGGVTLSGGEPAARPRFAAALLRACHERGIHTAIETCGYTSPEALFEVALAADLVLFDVKLIDPERHRRFTGVSNQRILSNLQSLAARRRVVVRIPVVPGVNDRYQDMCDFATELARLRVAAVELLPYHRIAAGKYRGLGMAERMKDTPAPTADEMARFRHVLEMAGLQVTIGGKS